MASVLNTDCWVGCLGLEFRLIAGLDPSTAWRETRCHLKRTSQHLSENNGRAQPRYHSLHPRVRERWKASGLGIAPPGVWSTSMGSIQQESADRTVTILVTGFGPFLERFPVNPSFEITKLLPDYLPAIKPHNTAVRIISYTTPVRVAYNEVRELVPKLLKAYQGTIDLVLHIGMASGRQHYALERYARRDGYTRSKDVDGKMPPFDEGRTLFHDCPQVMTPSLDFDGIVASWDLNILGIPKGQPGAGADTRPSEDAGRYLCDYIYFNSLAYLGRHNESMEGGKAVDRPVFFFHVPPESDAKSLDTGRAVAVALIRAIADTFLRQCDEEKVNVV